MTGTWVEHLSGRFHVRNHPGDVLATVEHTPAGWHAYVSEPGCSWSYSDTFTDQATALGAGDTAAAWWAAHVAAAAAPGARTARDRPTAALLPTLH